jgi:hypothetical protein
LDWIGCDGCNDWVLAENAGVDASSTDLGLTPYTCRSCRLEAEVAQLRGMIEVLQKCWFKKDLHAMAADLDAKTIGLLVCRNWSLTWCRM